MFLERAGGEGIARKNIAFEVKDDGDRSAESLDPFSQIDVKLTQLPATFSQVHVVENQCSVKLSDYSHYLSLFGIKKWASKCASSSPNFFNIIPLSSRFDSKAVSINAFNDRHSFNNRQFLLWQCNCPIWCHVYRLLQLNNQRNPTKLTIID